MAILDRHLTPIIENIGGDESSHPAVAGGVQ